MLSALLESLPSISTKQESGGIDFVTLLVSAYPDLQPWCINESSESDSDDRVGDFYIQYLSSLLHYEDGNDVAKRDSALIRVSL